MPLYQQMSAIVAMPARNKKELSAKALKARDLLTTLPNVETEAFKSLPTKEKRLLELFANLAWSFLVEETFQQDITKIDELRKDLEATLLKVKHLVTVPLINATIILLQERLNELGGKSYLLFSSEQGKQLASMSARNARNAAERKAAAAAAAKAAADEAAYERKFNAMKALMDEFIAKGMSPPRAHKELIRVESDYLCEKRVYDSQREVFAKHGRAFEISLLNDPRSNELIYKEPTAPWAKYMKGGGRMRS